MKDRKTVSLCMIVKDEDWILDRCLNSVRDIVDEIIIGDTGSKDNTKQIAAEYGAYIFDIKWEDDFAKARNLTLEKASCDWILLLDADEIFHEKDKDTFLTLLDSEVYDGYHFTLINYFTENNTREYSVHYAFRLLKNTGEYYFEGRIHEQINNIKGSLDSSLFTLAEVTLFHYGYTDRVMQSKNKHSRNMPLLEKQLEENPTEPYFLFNMGNEHMSQGEIDKALVCYLKSYEQRAIAQAYFPHIYYRILLCYITQKNYERALFFAEEGLSIYPMCTDLEFLRGSVFREKHRYVAAVASFKRCLSMGEAPNSLKFSGGCGTYKAYISLGEIYYEEDMFAEAFDSFSAAIKYSEAPDCSLSLGKAMLPLCLDGYEFLDRLIPYLPYAEEEIGYLHAVDILLETGQFETALFLLNQTHLFLKWEEDFLFLNGKLSLYLNLYDNASRSFSRLYERNVALSVLAYDNEVILAQHFISFILKYFQNPDEIMNFPIVIMSKYKSTCLIILNQLFPSIFTETGGTSLQYNFFFLLLELLLKINAMDIFYRLLPVMNERFPPDSYLKLGEIYARMGHRSDAVNIILSYIKNYSSIDKESAHRLSDCL